MIKRLQAILFISCYLLLLFLSGCITDPLETSENVFNDTRNIWYETIQGAINQAHAYDTLIVQPGIYNETLLISKTLTLRSVDPLLTVIQGNLTGNVIYVTADNVTIEGFSVRCGGNGTKAENYGGIKIESNDDRIINCIITENNQYGVYLRRSYRTLIKYCTIHSNGENGIYFYDSSYIQLDNNTVYNEKIGIYARLTNSSITTNTISSTETTGLFFGYISRDNMVKGNRIEHNNDGIQVKGGKENTFTENIFFNNTKGLYFCCGGSDNTVYRNVFMNNTHHSYGYPKNMFYKHTTGNYWDDYNGTDDDNDGRGDTPYLIPCVLDYCNQDDYPLMKPE